MPAPRRASRKPVVPRVPRTRAGGEMTEARFFAFLRSGLRQLSRRWPPVTRLVWLESRRPYKGVNPRAKWEYQCARCAKWYMRKDMQADHIMPCGALKSFEDLPGFAQRLLCETDSLRILCNHCHQEEHHGKAEA